MNKFPPGQSESDQKGHLRTLKPFSHEMGMEVGLPTL